MSETPLQDASQSFETWAIVEVMGHRTYAGMVREQVIGSTTFLRIDVPETSRKRAYTKYIGTGSVYAITPTDESTARIAAVRLDEPPVNPYVVPTEYQLAAQAAADGYHDEPDPDFERESFDDDYAF